MHHNNNLELYIQNFDVQPRSQGAHFAKNLITKTLLTTCEWFSTQLSLFLVEKGEGHCVQSAFGALCAICFCGIVCNLLLGYCVRSAFTHLLHSKSILLLLQSKLWWLNMDIWIYAPLDFGHNVGLKATTWPPPPPTSVCILSLIKRKLDNWLCMVLLVRYPLIKWELHTHTRQSVSKFLSYI